jgi:hypothetical protein
MAWRTIWSKSTKKKKMDTQHGWENLCEWYHGETVKSETATNLCIKLENLQLHARVSGSEYVNRFMAWYNTAFKHGDRTDKVNMPKGISVKNKIR